MADRQSASSEDAWTDIRDVWRQAKFIPIRERKQWGASEDAEQHRHDVEVERGFLRENLARIGPVPRGYRLRDEIIAAVSAEASEHYQRPITSRFVRQCWEEYRAADKEDV